MPNSSTSGHRANLSLRIEGVAAHDELLFKSLVRLLSYRTQHNWVFATGAVDLRIIGEDSPESAQSKPPANVLWVGHSEQHRSPFLHLPIHANELELLLNTLGASILKKQAAAHDAWPPAIGHDETFMLHRWPPAAMLGTTARIKLATLMTAHPVSIDTLALRSGIPSQECAMFCQALDRAGLLRRDSVPAPATPPHHTSETPALNAKPDLSLLSRIRRRLGL